MPDIPLRIFSLPMSLLEANSKLNFCIKLVKMRKSWRRAIDSPMHARFPMLNGIMASFLHLNRPFLSMKRVGSNFSGSFQYSSSRMHVHMFTIMNVSAGM